MNIYAQNILDRYKQPFHKDKVIDATISQSQVNHSCGDKITVRFKIQDSRHSGQALLEDYSFEGVGCAISMAAADILGDLIIGQPIETLVKMTDAELIEALGIDISERRMKCALLAFSSFKKCITDLS